MCRPLLHRKQTHINLSTGERIIIHRPSCTFLSFILWGFGNHLRARARLDTHFSHDFVLPFTHSLAVFTHSLLRVCVRTYTSTTRHQAPMTAEITPLTTRHTNEWNGDRLITLWREWLAAGGVGGGVIALCLAPRRLNLNFVRACAPRRFSFAWRMAAATMLRDRVHARWHASISYANIRANP